MSTRQLQNSNRQPESIASSASRLSMSISRILKPHVHRYTSLREAKSTSLLRKALHSSIRMVGGARSASLKEIETHRWGSSKCIADRARFEALIAEEAGIEALLILRQLSRICSCRRFDLRFDLFH